MEYVGLAASFAMGVTLGLMGGGGSILTVPILVYLFTLSPVVATGHSLFIVGITAFIGSLLFIRQGDVDFQTALAFALPSVIGVNFSRGFILPQIPEVVFQAGSFRLTKEILVMSTFALLMMTASFSMIRRKKDRKPFLTSSYLRAVLIALQGLIVGTVVGFVGAGGGFLIVPALVFLVGLPMRIAVGTSLTIIAFQSLLGFAGDVSRGMTVDWLLLGMVVMCAAMGIILGSRLAHKIEEQKLKITFGWFVLVIGAAIFIEQFRHLSS